MRARPQGQRGGRGRLQGRRVERQRTAVQKPDARQRTGQIVGALWDSWLWRLVEEKYMSGFSVNLFFNYSGYRSVLY